MFVRVLINPMGFLQRAFRFCSTTQNKKLLEEVTAKQNDYICKATFKELGFDSLKSVEMVVVLEKNFGINLDEDEADRIYGVGDGNAVFYKYVEQRNQIQVQQ